VIAVTEPTPLGAHDLEVILRLLSKLKKKGSIMINRSDIGDKKQIECLAEKYNSKIVFEVPFSREIINSYSRGEPISIKNILSVIGK
jgi:MinD superfamily P-loop ATPase